MWVLVVRVWVWWWCRWCLGVARLQGWEVARLQVYRQSKRIFVPLLLWFDVGMIDYFCTFGGLYRSGDGGGRAVVVWCGGGVGGMVVPVVGRDWQAIPPLDGL